MLDLFESMLVGDTIEAHDAKWYRIKQLRDDLENGMRLYLAAKIGDRFPAPTYVIAQPIEAQELERLRASEAKHRAEMDAIAAAGAAQRESRSKKP